MVLEMLSRHKGKLVRLRVFSYGDRMILSARFSADDFDEAYEMLQEIMEEEPEVVSLDSDREKGYTVTFMEDVTEEYQEIRERVHELMRELVEEEEEGKEEFPLPIFEA
ncbi:hypothetical protein [Methanopyrus sp.]